jgi:hypothetical protein
VSWTQDRIVTSLGMRLGDGVSIDLRGSLETEAFLTIGDDIETILGERHVRTLRNQAAAALVDMALIDAADEVVGDAHDAGAQAHTATLGCALIGWREPFSFLYHPGFQPFPDQVPGWERPERFQYPVVVDLVEGVPDTLRASMT